MTREEAWELLCEFTPSESLRKHGLAVEAAMRHYARLRGEDEFTWGLVGLLHDFDYERWPSVPGHTREGAQVLRARGVDEEVVGAILSHVPWNLEDYPRDRPLRKTLFAVDELAGFIVRPSFDSYGFECGQPDPVPVSGGSRVRAIREAGNLAPFSMM
jgi:putative nucleotidyltransferase with HDIG domain